MTLKLYQPHKILIEKEALPYPATQRILRNCPDTPWEIIKDTRAVMRQIRSRMDPIGEGKRYLLLAYDKGRSFKPFPESEQYLSCDYYTLHLAEGCDLECSYCILQSYLTNPLLTVFVNVEESLKKLQDILDSQPEKFFRIGTGQLADSLSLDHLTEFSEILVPFFAHQKNAVLELKTKSTNIENLMGLFPNEKTIVSWSMNSKKIQKEEEHKCASIEERIQAAKKITSWGYRLGFHFDPIIDYPGWEKDYSEVIHEVFNHLPAEKIAWVSLGCLRMMPDLKGIMRERFPKSPLSRAEWIHGMDGKLRYFKPKRIVVYQNMVAMIRKFAPELTIYLCMESPEVWRHVFGQEPTKEMVCALLDQASGLQQVSSHMTQVTNIKN